MASIGGIFSFLSAITFVMISYMSTLEWNKSLISEIKGNSTTLESENEDEVMEELKQRVSFKGIYQLHDHVGMIRNMLKENE
tara:strand:- start:302 stop:547 length:246 start_codon:yes stop_codon:yes gene_type:complete